MAMAERMWSWEMSLELCVLGQGVKSALLCCGGIPAPHEASPFLHPFGLGLHFCNICVPLCVYSSLCTRAWPSSLSEMSPREGMDHSEPRREAGLKRQEARTRLGKWSAWYSVVSWGLGKPAYSASWRAVRAHVSQRCGGKETDPWL